MLLQTGLVFVDDWLKMAAPAQTGVLFKQLRLTLHSILKGLISKPQVPLWFCFPTWYYCVTNSLASTTNMILLLARITS